MENTKVEQPKLSIKKYVKKSGEMVIKEYNQKEYNKKFYEKNKEKYTTKIKCRCGGGYTAPNKTKHKDSRIHQLWEMYNLELTTPKTL